MNFCVGQKVFIPQISKLKAVNSTALTPKSALEVPKYTSNPMAFRSYVSFTGNAPKITKATVITTTGNDIPLEKTKNGGYMVEDKTKTELIYGNDANNFLKETSHFKYDTQITFPIKAKGRLYIDNKIVDIKENSSILINKGTDAAIIVDEGYPQILMTKKEYTWYNKHSNQSEKALLKDKFKELITLNSHTYNGEFKPKLFTNNETFDNYLTKKLVDTDEVENKNEYIKFKHYPVWDYKKEILAQKGFNEDEMNIIKPVYEQARKAKLYSKIALKCDRKGLKDSTVQKLEENDIIFKNKNDKKFIYWKTNYESKEQLKNILNEKNIVGREQKTILKAWNTNNKIGYDITGLKFINDNVAVYNLNDKINNWSGQKSCWLTNSTALANKNSCPSIGTSIVQANEEQPTPMSKLRGEEHLHIHPGYKNKSQTELYMVTSGSAALTVVKNGKPQIKVLREGELAIVPPNTPHCVNSVMGEYEQVVSQVPSAFQYGLAFKENMDLPAGYTTKQMEELAKEELLKKE